MDVIKEDIGCSIVKSCASIKKDVCDFLELNKAFERKHCQIIVIK